MASISKRMRKNGFVFHIQVKVKDPKTREHRIVPKTWKPPENMTLKQAEREVVLIANEFEEEIKKLYSGTYHVTCTADTLFEDYKDVWLENCKKVNSLSHYVQARDNLEVACRYLGKYKMREMTPSIIQWAFDEIDKLQFKKITVDPKVEEIRKLMKETGLGYMKLRYEKKLCSYTLSNILVGKRVSYDSAERFAKVFGVPVDKIFTIQI